MKVLNIDKIRTPKTARNGKIYVKGETVIYSGSNGGNGTPGTQIDWTKFVDKTVDNDMVDTMAIRFGHTNQTDATDGTIAAGKYGQGLNIIGAQTVAGQGRKIQLWGKLLSPDGIESPAYSAQTNLIANDGTGYKLSNVGGITTLEIDNIRIRKSLIAAELLIKKVRASNGSIWVTDAAKVKSGLTLNEGSGFLVFEDTQVFAAGDIITAQGWTGGAYVYTFVVQNAGTNSDGSYVHVLNLDTSVPSLVDLTGKEFVRIGNASNSSRRGSLYLTSSDSNSPYIEVLDGMTNATIANSNRKVRLGKLDGLTMTDGSAMSGYGLYTNNGYFEGKIVATSGTFKSAETGKRIEIDGIAQRMTFFSANGDNSYVRIDDNIYGYGKPGIALSGGVDGIYSMFNPNTFLLGGSSSHGIHFYVDANETNINFNGLPLWSTIQPNPDYWAVVRVNRVTGQVSYSD